MKIKTEYKSYTEFIGWSKAEEFIQKLIKENNIKSILEVGAGANPTIRPEFIQSNQISYTISDINADELAKADDVYVKQVLDLNAKEVLHPFKYDLIFSRMVGEHIKNGYYFHKNIFSLLNDGGISFHCFSTLYSFPFTINRFLPEALSDTLLRTFAPRDKRMYGKFKAYYSWCRGPSQKNIKRFEKIGYSIQEYTGYFGHNYYAKIPLINKLENLKAGFLIKRKYSLFTSYAHILLKKP